MPIDIHGTMQKQVNFIGKRHLTVNGCIVVQEKVMGFNILGEIRDVESIARGRGVYIWRYLERTYGRGRWRKMKGSATVRLADNSIS